VFDDKIVKTIYVLVFKIFEHCFIMYGVQRGFCKVLVDTHNSINH